MVWPDIPRRLWSYAIGKLKLFTNIDESKLEIGIKSLALNDVEFDVSKMLLTGFATTKLTAKRLSIELLSLEIVVKVTDICLEGELIGVDNPEVVLSTFVSNAMQDFAEFSTADLRESLKEAERLTETEEPTNSTTEVKKELSMLEKLTATALGQVTVQLSNVSLNIKLHNSEKGINVHMESLSWSGNKCIDINLITLTTSRGELYSRDSLMDQSVYFDSHSIAFKDPVSLYGSTVEGININVGTIDRIVVDYTTFPFTLDIDVKMVRIDGLMLLDMLVSTLNQLLNFEIIGQNSDNTNSSKNQTEEGEISLGLDVIEIYDYESHGSSSKIELLNIAFANKRFAIGSLKCDGIIILDPFLNVDIDTFNSSNGQPEMQLKITVVAPINLLLSRQQLRPFMEIVTRLTNIVSSVNLPPSDNPAKFDVFLPDIQIQIEDLMKLQIFTDKINHELISLDEAVLTIGEGQLAVDRITVSLTDSSIVINGVKIMLRPSLYENVELIRHSLINNDLNDDYKVSDKYLETSAYNLAPKIAFTPPNIKLKVKSLEIRDDDFRLYGNLNLVSSMEYVDLHSKLTFTNSLFSTKISVHCCSFPDFTSIVGNIRFSNSVLKLKKMDTQDNSLDVNNTNKQTKTVEANRENNTISSLFNELLLNLDIFLEAITIQFPDENRTLITVEPQHLTLTAGANKINVQARQAFLYLIDSADNGAKIPILKLESFKATINDSEILVRLKKISISCCADSIYILAFASASLTTESPDAIYKVQLDDDIDLLQDVTDDFVIKNLTDNNAQANEDLHVDSLKITDEYLLTSNNDFTSLVGAIQTVIPDRYKFKIKFHVRKFEWNMHDGYDFYQTRSRMMDAISRLAHKGKNKSKPQQSNTSTNLTEEKAIMGDLLYNSVIITPETNEEDRIKYQIQQELGGSGNNGLSRSKKPKTVLHLKDANLSIFLSESNDTNLKVRVRKGEVCDMIVNSIYPKVVAPFNLNEHENIFELGQKCINENGSLEYRIRINLQPLKITLDQDTVEFLNRYFQFDGKENVYERLNDDDAYVLDSFDLPELDLETVVEGASNPSKQYLQMIDLSDISLVIDYNPKKVDYRILRSGGTAQLLNVFPIKGAKLRLHAVTLYGVNGWDALLDEILKIWMPDIKANQLTSLIAGFSPVRKVIKASQRVRRSSASRITNVVMKRTYDEINRIKSHFMG